MLASYNCMVFVNSAVLVQVITLSNACQIFIVHLLSFFYLDLFNTFGCIAWRHFLMEDKSRYAAPLLLRPCLLVVYTEMIIGSEYFVVPIDTCLPP